MEKKPLHEIMAQMLSGGKLEEAEANVVGKQPTAVTVDREVKDQNQEAIDTANIIKSAPTREDPNKKVTEIDDEDVDGIADGILVVTDPEITSEEFEEVADELQGIVDNTDIGELPFTDKYEGDYILSCPICGGTFVHDTLLDSGEDTCPICCKIPDAFVVNGRVENQETAVEQDDMQDDIEHEENLEEPVEEETPAVEPTEQPLDVEEEEEPIRKESKEISGTKLEESKLEEDEMEDYLAQEKALAEDYMNRIINSMPQEAKTAFYDLKDILETEDRDTQVDGFYFPAKAVAVIMSAKGQHNLNAYMDLTISDVLNMVADNETPEAAIKTLFDDYKADSALAWGDNFVEVLKKLDFDMIDNSDFEIYDWELIGDEDSGEFKIEGAGRDGDKEVTFEYDLEQDVINFYDFYTEERTEVNNNEFIDAIRELSGDELDESKKIEEVKKWEAQDFSERIDQAISDELGRVYEDFGVTSGDIAPDQSEIWDECVARLNKMFNALCEQNAPYGLVEESKLEEAKLTEGEDTQEATDYFMDALEKAVAKQEIINAECLDEFLQNAIGLIREIAADKGLYVESKKVEACEKKEEYIEKGFSSNPLSRDMFEDFMDVEKYIKDQGYELLDGDHIEPMAMEIRIFDPNGNDGEVYVYELIERKDGVKLRFDAKDSFNMNESKKVTEGIEYRDLDSEKDMDRLGSDAEVIDALYLELGMQVDETWDNVAEDMDSGKLKVAIIDNDEVCFVYDDGARKGYTLGRANDNMPIVKTGDVEKEIKLTEKKHLMYIDEYYPSEERAKEVAANFEKQGRKTEIEQTGNEWAVWVTYEAVSDGDTIRKITENDDKGMLWAQLPHPFMSFVETQIQEGIIDEDDEEAKLTAQDILDMYVEEDINGHYEGEELEEMKYEIEAWDYLGYIQSEINRRCNLTEAKKEEPKGIYDNEDIKSYLGDIAKVVANAVRETAEGASIEMPTTGTLMNDNSVIVYELPIGHFTGDVIGLGEEIANRLKDLLESGRVVDVKCIPEHKGNKQVFTLSIIGPDIVAQAKGKKAEGVEKMQEAKVINIEWDTENDGEIADAAELGLPAEVTVPSDVEDIADYLSDKYGYCVINYDIELKESKIEETAEEVAEEPVEESKLVEDKQVWSSAPEYVDENDVNFKEWMEQNGYDIEEDALETAEGFTDDPTEEDIETAREQVTQHYLEMYNQDDNEMMIEDWNVNIIPMIENQLNTEDLLILMGRAQTWRGTGDAARMFKGTNDFQSMVAEYDEISLYTDDADNLTINLAHHDGTHRMGMYTFNGDYEGIYNKLIDLGDNEFADFEDYEDATSMYYDEDMVEYMIDNGYQAELSEFLVPIKWR